MERSPGAVSHGICGRNQEIEIGTYTSNTSGEMISYSDAINIFAEVLPSRFFSHLRVEKHIPFEGYYHPMRLQEICDGHFSHHQLNLGRIKLY
jgi:hypothetical protein